MARPDGGILSAVEILCHHLLWRRGDESVNINARPSYSVNVVRGTHSSAMET